MRTGNFWGFLSTNVTRSPKTLEILRAESRSISPKEIVGRMAWYWGIEGIWVLVVGRGLRLLRKELRFLRAKVFFFLTQKIDFNYNFMTERLLKK
jgi:hypothetical protein